MDFALEKEQRVANPGLIVRRTAPVYMWGQLPLVPRPALGLDQLAVSPPCCSHWDSCTVVAASSSCREAGDQQGAVEGQQGTITQQAKGFPYNWDYQINSTIDRLLLVILQPARPASTG